MSAFRPAWQWQSAPEIHAGTWPPSSSSISCSPPLIRVCESAAVEIRSLCMSTVSRESTRTASARWQPSHLVALPSGAMLHIVHYPVLSAGQVFGTLGRGTALDRLLKVLSTARYRTPQATEGQGAEGHQVLQVSVRTVHRLRYGHALTTQPAGRHVCGFMYILVPTHAGLLCEGAPYRLWSRSGSPWPPQSASPEPGQPANREGIACTLKQQRTRSRIPDA